MMTTTSTDFDGIAVVSPKSPFARRCSLGLKSIRPITYNTLQQGEPTSPRCYFS